MRNRSFRATVTLLALCFASAPLARADTKRPNVLFIAIDDLNDWISSLGGHPDCRTPHLDRLAARGVLFTKAYCSAPACNPSRASLMTGRRPSTSGVYHNRSPWRLAMPKVRTLPQHLMDHGYFAAGGGKIYHGSFPDPASWNEYFRRPADPMPDRKDRPLNKIGKKISHFDWGPVDASDAEMGDTQVFEWADGILKRKHDKPFFLAVGFYRPHLPWFVPKKYFKPHPEDKVTLPVVKDDDLADIPEAGRRMAKPDGDHRRVVAANQWRKAVAGYLASVEFVDTLVGRLVDSLDKSAHAKNTIIVLWTDHGWHLGEKHHWRKFALWEEATRVPMMVVAPGITPAGKRCDRTVSLLDLYPTIGELCGLPARPGVEGRSLVPLLKDPAAGWDRPVVTTHGRNNHAVRGERWRYIRYADGSEELYDHSKDPMEWTNVASRSELAAVKTRLAKWLPTKNVPTVTRVNKKQRKNRQNRQRQR